MKKLFMLTTAVLLFLSCKKEMSENLNNEIEKAQFTEVATQVAENAMGAIRISGIGYFADPSECDYGSQGAAFAVKMTGDLVGCLYVFVDEYECSPSGTYREVGREHFIGTYNGVAGTFWTTYKFESKFEGCAPDGHFLGIEIFGRCQHPIVGGSGTGAFQNVSGRLDLKDDIEAGNYPYRGHLRF